MFSYATVASQLPWLFLEADSTLRYIDIDIDIYIYIYIYIHIFLRTYSLIKTVHKVEFF